MLQLAVTPRITPEDDIVMELDIKQDTVGRIYHGVPSINTTRIETRVRVADGETVVLGGIFQTDRYRTATQTPLLGDLPLIGPVFRRTLERDDKQELFIFITPRSADGTSPPEPGESGVPATAAPLGSVEKRVAPRSAGCASGRHRGRRGGTGRCRCRRW